MEGRGRDNEGHPAVQMRRHRPKAARQEKRRMCRPRSAVDPRELRAAAQNAQSRRNRSRTTVDKADVWVALEMQRLQHQGMMLQATPPGSRSSFGSLSSWTSSGSLAMSQRSGSDTSAPPPAYESHHRKVDSPGLHPPLAPPPGFGSPRMIRSASDAEERRHPTPPADRYGLSGVEMEQLMQLAGPDVQSERPYVLSSLRSFEHLVERCPEVDDDEEESNFDGVTTRQLEDMRLLQVQQELLLVEQAQLDALADPSNSYDLAPPPAYASDRAMEPSLPMYVGGVDSGHGTLPGYLPAPPAFADVEAECDDFQEADDILAELMSNI